MLQPHPHAHIRPPPHHTKRFHVEGMRRIPIAVSDEARGVLDRSSHQSRIFPQALSEFFGTLREVSHVEIELVEDRLKITVRHRQEHKDHTFFMAVLDLTNVSEQPHAGFEAAAMADELLRLYRTHILREEA